MITLIDIPSSDRLLRRLRVAEKNLKDALNAGVGEEEYAPLACEYERLRDLHDLRCDIRNQEDSLHPVTVGVALAEMRSAFDVMMAPDSSEAESRAAMRRYREMRSVVAPLCVETETSGKVVQ